MEAERLIEQDRDVPHEWKNLLYLEWFSTINGRVIIESADFQLQVSEHSWMMDGDVEVAQKLANLNAMRDFMAQVIRRRNPGVLQHIYNLLEQHPGKAIQEAAAGADTMTFIRVPHSSGMLEGKYTADTVFPPGDHRVHRPRSWLLNGVKKIDQLRFLERTGERTLGQAAILWLLGDERIASVLPNIYDSEQLREFAAAPDGPSLTADEREKVAALVAANFGLEPEEPRFKGTMTLEEPATA